MKIVLTGASGQVGAELLKYLPDAEFEIDTERRDITKELEFPPCDVVVHSAGLKFGWKSVKNPKPYIETNILGTFNVLEAARKVNPKLFVYISSVEAAIPTTPYGASKAAGEALTLSYWHSYGLSAIVIRIPALLVFTTEGDGFVAKLMRREKLKINDNSKEWITGEDLARGVLRHIKEAELGHIYTLSGAVLSDGEIAELCRKMS